MRETASLGAPGATHLSDITWVLTTDLVGIARGRAVALADYESGRTNFGWCPTNTAITPFNVIADGDPFGSRGDVRLVADGQARYRTPIHGSPTALDMVMGDVVELDGSPWACCPRFFLKQALADLEREAGLTLLASFEQELSVLSEPWPPAAAFSLAGLRRTGDFGPAVLAALMSAGVAPEQFIPEYGADQFELTSTPAAGLVAADRAVAAREIVKEVARVQGFRASFAPKAKLAGVGNGVHIHVSVTDRDGTPAFFDAHRPGRLSEIGGAFAAGIVRHLPALVALTAPSPISYLRLKPHNWSASYTWLGERDRESTIRICPTFEAGGRDPARQFNLEYRAADACAAPHLALGAIVRAGLAGINERLPAPPIVDGDPTLMSETELERLGLRRLPESLGEALAAFDADATVSGWFDETFRQAYTATKRTEIKIAEGLDGDAQCARYAEIY